MKNKTLQRVLGRISSVEAAKNYQPFTKSYYRENLKIFTDTYPSNKIHAHHVFPQEFKEIFLKKGINIHHPKHLTWWESKSHLKAARSYNAKWEWFFDENPEATAHQILEAGVEIMGDYGIKTNY